MPETGSPSRRGVSFVFREQSHRQERCQEEEEGSQRRGSSLLPPWRWGPINRSYVEIRRPSVSDVSSEAAESSESPTRERTAEPRIPRFAWEPVSRDVEEGEEEPADDSAREQRVQDAIEWSRLKTMFIRSWIWIVFIIYNGYSFYMAAGDLHNTIVVLNPRLRAGGTEEAPYQLTGGAFTYMGSQTSTNYLECWLVMFVALLTKLTIWLTMLPFLTVIMHWKAEPKLFLPDLMPDRNDWPTVDIILPRYKEAWESFEPTVRATIARPTSEALPKQISLQDQDSSMESSMQFHGTHGTSAPQSLSLEERRSPRSNGKDGTSADSSMHRSGPAIPESQSLHGRPYTDILPPHLRSPISRDGRSMSTIRPPELGAPTLDRNKRRGSLWRAFQPFRNIVRYSFTALAPLPAPLTLGDDSSAPPSGQTHTDTSSQHTRPYTDIPPPHLRSPISRTGRTMSTIRPPQLRRPIFNRRRSLWSLFLPTDTSPRYNFTGMNPFNRRGTRDPAVDNLHQHDLVPWRSTELPPTRHSPAMRGVRQRILTPWASAELSRVRLRPPVSHDEASTPLLPVVSPPSKVVPLPSWTPKMEPYMPPAQEPQTETELQPQRSLREVAHGPSEIQEVHASHEHHRLMDSPSSLPSSSFDHHSPLSQTSSPEFAQQSYWSRPVKAGSMHVRLERPPLDVLQPVPSLELSSTSSKGAEPEEWHNPFVASGVTLDYPPSKLNIYIADDGSRDPATSIADQVQQLKASLPPGSPNVHYITRESGHNAKGGNLNSCLKYANGKLVSVLDADHVVSPEFLLWTVPHFLSAQKKQHRDVEAGGHTAERTEWSLEGNKTGLCQTKQYFYNEHDFVPTLVGADNKIYYYLYQHGLTGMDAACCVGTGYVMRRQALDSAGGYVGGFAVEDSLTST
uniref:Glycosyltransferase 2-like domain-containing protein n=1 Tax=Dunaliella tertiolecta TaxID=3047 RepID=A0A7S3R584_DUNTE